MLAMLTKEKTTMTRKSTEEEEQLDRKIDLLVFSHQAGNEQALLELLTMFGGDPEKKKMNGFLGKYYKLFRKGTINFKNKESRRFVNLFIADPGVRKGMQKSRQSKHVRDEANKSMRKVSTSLRFMDDEEIKNELIALFINKCNRYTYTGRSFRAYLSNSYFFDAYRFVNNLQKKYEPYVHMQADLLHIAEDLVLDTEMETEVNDSVFNQSPVMFLDDELGNAWVRGLTCGDEFKDLTPLQRMITKFNHFDGMSDREIADVMGMHINTIFRQRKKAALLIEEKVKQLTEEGYYR